MNLLLDDAAKMGIVRLGAGGTVALHPGAFQERRWTVAEVLSAVVYLFRDVMAGFEEGFGELFSVHMMNARARIREVPRPDYFVAAARKERAQAIFTMNGVVRSPDD